MPVYNDLLFRDEQNMFILFYKIFEYVYCSLYFAALLIGKHSSLSTAQ